MQSCRPERGKNLTKLVSCMVFDDSGRLSCIQFNAVLF
jgi:hypothetical protein